MKNIKLTTNLTTIFTNFGNEEDFLENVPGNIENENGNNTDGISIMLSLIIIFLLIVVIIRQRNPKK